MAEIILFVLGSILFFWISRHALRELASHGFYRFFAWEAILGFFVLNLRSWFVHPFAWYQLISWLLLLISIIPLTWGLILLYRSGQPSGGFEKTTRLVQNGLFHYIRHPLYSSLLFLTWGIFFKSPSLLGCCLAAVTTAFLYATACADQAECLQKFGEQYASYMKKTRMFIPFLF
jgi:protein-S-isoprenylcysteine O-methyltransferase Ste14